MNYCYHIQSNYNKQLACFVTINNQKYDHIDDKQRGC